MKCPSAIFYAIREVAAALDDIAWPAHPVTGEKPQVDAGELFAPPTDERVQLLGRVDEPSSQDFVSFGNGAVKEEEFALGLLVSTVCPGSTFLDACARLEQLVGEIERTFRSSTSGRPTGLFASPTADDPQCITWEVTTVNPTVWPTAEGFAGDCLVTIGFIFAI